MESVSDSGMFSNPNEMSLDLSEDSEKNARLSSVTAKYNMFRKESDSFRNDTQPKQENIYSKSKTFLTSNSGYLSSEDGDSSDSEKMSGFSLAAFAVKNRTSKSHLKDKFEIAGTGAVLKDPISIQNSIEEFNSDLSDNEGFSLNKLASKHKSSQLSSSSINAFDNSSLNTSKSDKDCSDDAFGGKVPKNTVGLGTIDSSVTNTNKSNDKIISTFIAATFSDSSDSDEFMSLAGLGSKYKNNTLQEGTGSKDDLKPRVLTRITSTQRYHTKSESDTLSPVSVLSSIKKGFVNETSISLSSLKDDMETGNDFQFSLGCTIPNSFKSKQIGSTSSLMSLGTGSPHTKHSHSDTDVRDLSIVKKPSSTSVCSPLKDQDPTRDVTDVEFGGINLSCAIKIPSISKSSDNEMSQMDTDLSNEPEELEIMTLLDQLDVEDKKEDFKDKLEEDCTYDATCILTVKMKLRTKKCSSFGKVICRKWSPMCAPYIKKKILQSTVVPFTFSTLSPDDEIASYLNKRH